MRYKYQHINKEDYFVLGRCCIKKYSNLYKAERKCIECECKIRKNKTNLCKNCNEKRIQKEKEELSYRCKQCNYKMKTNKYKFCYLCNKARNLHNN